ncbi:uncharacterized protein DS421_5g160540 [Arachis hypogaea]|nr:uncharacterized protein DS421_5g160540 [Arachis hypogaea]
MTSCLKEKWTNEGKTHIKEHDHHFSQASTPQFTDWHVKLTSSVLINIPYTLGRDQIFQLDI